MPFQPEVNQELTIDDVTYHVAEHPAAPGIPYGQEGRQAIVYQLVSPSPSQGEGRGGVPDRRALKVFKPRYRLPEMVSVAERIAPHAALQGLQVCRRTVLTPQRHAPLLRQHPDLTYAVLMHWVEGPTWMEVLLEKRTLSPKESLALARSLAEILAGMEQRRLAHCDLSGPNVLLPALAQSATCTEPSRSIPNPQSAIALVDVEQLYGPGLERPELLPGGSPGYAHRTAPQGLWGAKADRFAGAVLLGEMLGWCDERMRETAWGENYFDPQGMQRESERYQLLVSVMRETWGAGVAGLFERAWRSETLADCATFGEWLVTLPEEAPVAVSPLPQAGEGPGVRAEAEDTLKMLMDLGRRLEGQGNVAGALEVYRQAQALAPAGSGLAEELALIVQDVEAKQAEVVISEPEALVEEEIAEVIVPAPQPTIEEIETEAIVAEPQPLEEETGEIEPVVPAPQSALEDELALIAQDEAVKVAVPTPQLPMEEVEAEATVVEPQPLEEEAKVEPVVAAPQSALERELALIAQDVETEEEKPAVPEPEPQVEEKAEAEVASPPSVDKETELDRLFDDGLAAYRREEWAKAKESLAEVVRQQPAYERLGRQAAGLLAEVEGQLAPPQGRRMPGWTWAMGAVAVVIVLWALFSSGGTPPVVEPTNTRRPTATVAAAEATSTPNPMATVAALRGSQASLFECTDAIGCVTVAPGDPVRIGYALVIAGPNESLGVDSRRGIEIAIADHDTKVLEHPIELVGEDAMCSAEGGQTALTKLTSDPSLIGIIGTNCSSAGEPASRIASDAGMVLLSPSNTAPSLTNPDLAWNPGYFRICHNDNVQGAAMAKYVYEELGARTAATIHDGSPYADQLQEVFANTFKELGGAITAQEAVNVGDTDMRPILTTIAADAPDFLYYPIFIREGAQITMQAKEIAGLENTTLAGADSMYSPDLVEAAGAACEGMYISGPNLAFENPIYDHFLEVHQADYGEAPLNLFHAQAYDGTMMLLAAVEKVAVQDEDGMLHIGRQALRDALYATKDYDGITGSLTCDQYGDCADPEIAVNQITNGEYVPLWEYVP